MNISGLGLNNSVVNNPADRIRNMNEELAQKILKLAERDKRDHTDVFGDIRRDEKFLKNYSKMS